jgi:hypothetical protein
MFMKAAADEMEKNPDNNILGIVWAAIMLIIGGLWQLFFS